MAKWITVPEDTATSMTDQDEIAATFCVHAASGTATQVLLKKGSQLAEVLFSNGVSLDKRI